MIWGILVLLIIIGIMYQKKFRKSPLEELIRREANGDTMAQQQVNSFVKDEEQAERILALRQKIFRQEAEKGNAEAQYNYAKLMMLFNQKEEEFIYTKRAAEQGHVSAMEHLGTLYENRDEKGNALIWYRRAAEKGNAGAECSLGFDCKMKKDLEEAVRWFEKAVKHEPDSHLYNKALADAYKSYFDAPKGYYNKVPLLNDTVIADNARRLYLKCLELVKNIQNDSEYADMLAGEDTFQLGNLYEQENCSLYDPKKALFWYVQSGIYGYKYAHDYSTRLTEHTGVALTDEEWEMAVSDFEKRTGHSVERG